MADLTALPERGMDRMEQLRPAASVTLGRVAPGEMSAANEAYSSGISWGAVTGGAFVAAALSLALLALGTGIGFSAVSPWTTKAPVDSAIGWAAVAWLVLIQLAASSMGGYLAGRLRTKWVGLHTHEVYFRDTAHGFLAWAVAVVITAAFLTSAAATLVGDVGRTNPASPTAVGGRDAATLDPNAYVVDMLLRTGPSGPERDNEAVRAEVDLIFANDVLEGGLRPADRSYLIQIVAARTGLSVSEAAKRVDEGYALAVSRVEGTRRAIAHSMYWTFLALLIGAFSASLAATLGGRQRDRA